MQLHRKSSCVLIKNGTIKRLASSDPGGNEGPAGFLDGGEYLFHKFHLYLHCLHLVWFLFRNTTFLMDWPILLLTFTATIKHFLALPTLAEGLIGSFSSRTAIALMHHLKPLLVNPPVEIGFLSSFLFLLPWCSLTNDWREIINSTKKPHTRRTQEDETSWFTFASNEGESVSG